jgi:photosynthetic reaction center M subunit
VVTKILTAAVVGEEPDHKEKRPAIERAMEGEVVSFPEVEKAFKKRGGTIVQSLFGADPFDFWLGRFYVGAFGVMSLIGIFFGVTLYLYQAWVVEGTYNILRARIDPTAH